MSENGYTRLLDWNWRLQAGGLAKRRSGISGNAAWGMYFHELMYGIPIDRTKDIDDRRKAVVNRRDRTSRSSITPYRLENIIQTVFGLSASVSEQVEKYIFNVDLLIGADHIRYIPSIFRWDISAK